MEAFMRTNGLRASGIVCAAVLVAAVAAGCDASGGSGDKTGSATSTSTGSASPSAADVPTTFPVTQHQPFAEPPVLTSKDGVLETTFTVKQQDFDVAGTTVKGYAYDGQFIGPTLHVQPGDTVRIHLRNELDEPTNLHSHGVFVSPIGDSDNVLRVMQPSSDNDFVLRLPTDLDPGTYWYHSHLHGRTEAQVFAGLAGLFVVDGLAARLPAPLQEVPEHVVALKDLQVKDGAIVTENIDSNAPTTRTVNGLVDPVLTVRTNETTMLRLANISADIWYKLQLDGAQFHVIAEDANPVADVWTADELVLPPGKRFDVLVRWPKAGTHVLTTLEYSNGPDGDTYPERQLATITVAGDPVPDTAWPTSVGPPSELLTAKVDRTREFVFSENTTTNQFYINKQQFDITKVNVAAKLGAVEEWTLKNVSGEAHPFHIHVNDFIVTSINGKPYDTRSEQDIVSLPPKGEVKIRMKYNRFLGTYVFHCHILAHEDNGMMMIVDVSKDGVVSKATQAKLQAIKDEMGAMK
jgi:FtsP/CotA-like multicopper oxidase with cupredoxin domain